jgi:hypothetical protein
VEQLKDSGITWALAGHSERRVILAEDDSVSKIVESGFGQKGTEPLKCGFAYLIVNTNQPNLHLVYCKKDQDCLGKRFGSHFVRRRDLGSEHVPTAGA